MSVIEEYHVGRVEELKDGEVIAVRAGRKVVALARVGDQFFALQNRCVHRGASLCDGILDPERRVLRCPWHYWDWNLESGRLAISPMWRLPVLRVVVRDGEVYLHA